MSGHLLRPTGVQGDRSRRRKRSIDTKGNQLHRRPRPGNTQPGRRAPSQLPYQRMKTGFVRVLEILENAWILTLCFQGLKSAYIWDEMLENAWNCNNFFRNKYLSNWILCLLNGEIKCWRARKWNLLAYVWLRSASLFPCVTPPPWNHYCTMPGGCRFNERWLEDEKYKLWIKRGQTPRVASCKVCKKDVQLFTMGESALSSHMKSKS